MTGCSLKSQVCKSALHPRECTGCHICRMTHEEMRMGQEANCFDKGVVYNLTCNYCGENYVGETGRSLAERLQDHLQDPTSSAFQHAQQCKERKADEEPSWSVGIVARCGHYVKRLCMEALTVKELLPPINKEGGVMELHFDAVEEMKEREKKRADSRLRHPGGQRVGTCHPHCADTAQ